MKLKYLFYIAVAISLGLMAQAAADMWKDYKGYNRLHQELIGQKEAYVQLSKVHAKLAVNYESEKDLHEKAKKEWGEVSKAKNERIKLLSDATYLISRHVEKQNGPDYSFRTKRGTRNYILNEIRIAGKDSPAIGYILIKNDGRTYKRNYAFEIQVKNLQTIDENTGKIKFYAKAFLVQKESSLLAKRVEGYKDQKDVKYPLEITGGTVLYDPTIKNQLKNRFMWTMNFNGGVNVGAQGDSLLKGALGVSFAGYGPHKADLKYKLLQVGAGFNSDATFANIHLIPVSIRPLPKFLKNTYIGPGIGYTTDNRTVFFLNTSIGF